MNDKVNMCRDVKSGLYSKPDVFGKKQAEIVYQVAYLSLILNHGTLSLVC